MRKRKSSNSSESDSLYPADGRRVEAEVEAEVLRVVPISNTVWLCVGLIIGTLSWRVLSLYILSQDVSAEVLGQLF